MASWLFKIFVLPAIYFISVLPFAVLYRLSDFFYVLVYHIIGYRKTVVLQNLEKSFPEKSREEISQITRQFYRHFCDTIFETIKVLTISEKNFKKHCYFTEEVTRIFHHYESRQRGLVCVLGHCGNWEWALIGHEVYFNVLMTGVYHPLTNQPANDLIYKIRTRFGGRLVPMKNTIRELVDQEKKGIVSNLGLISDQTPPPENAYWTTFLNQGTPVFYGAEKIAKKFNFPVVFISMKKIKRGLYEIGGELLTADPAAFPDGAITGMHTQALEKKIREQPYTWLWTHRRWKHKRQA